MSQIFNKIIFDNIEQKRLVSCSVSIGVCRDANRDQINVTSMVQPWFNPGPFLCELWACVHASKGPSLWWHIAMLLLSFWGKQQLPVSCHLTCLWLYSPFKGPLFVECFVPQLLFPVWIWFSKKAVKKALEWNACDFKGNDSCMQLIWARTCTYEVAWKMMLWPFSLLLRTAGLLCLKTSSLCVQCNEVKKSQLWCAKLSLFCDVTAG